MAYPSPAHSTHHAAAQSASQRSGPIHSTGPAGPPFLVPGAGTTQARTARHRLPASPCGTPTRGDDHEHQREKLEFALAVALTRGDHQREQVLRDQIAALGGNYEEPGT